MSKQIKRISLLAVGIAMFVVLSLCLQVPVFENYYLCLGYVVMAVYCCSFGTLESLLYAQPFLVRVAKNTSAFIADCVMLIISLPVCRVLDPYAKKLFPELYAG